MNASTVTVAAAPTLFVVVSRPVDSEACFNIHYTAEGAQDDLDETVAEYNKDRAFDARMTAKGWKGPLTPVTTFEIVIVTGAKAAEMEKIQNEIDFNSQDEAQADTRSDLYTHLAAAFFAA